jgi:hypothetical protein
MLLESEVLLMAAAVSLYLYDSSLLLYVNEGILIPRGERAWLVGFGSDRARIMGKEIFVPNPLSPHRPLFRLSWKFEGESVVSQSAWALRRGAFRPLAPMVWCMAVSLFVFLPLGLFTRLGDRLILSAILLLYLSIIFALLWTWFNRSTYDLSRKRFAGLAFESLACSPFALNLIRKISSRMPVDEDLVSAACRLQTTDDWRVTRSEMMARLDEEIEGEEDDSQRARILKEHRRKLSERDATCPPPKSS